MMCVQMIATNHTMEILYVRFILLANAISKTYYYVKLAQKLVHLAHNFFALTRVEATCISSCITSSLLYAR